MVLFYCMLVKNFFFSQHKTAIKAVLCFPALAYVVQVERVAGSGFEPEPGGYEPPEVPLLHPAIKQQANANALAVRALYAFSP